MIGNMGMRLEFRKQLENHCNGKSETKLIGIDLVKRKGWIYELILISNQQFRYGIYSMLFEYREWTKLNTIH